MSDASESQATGEEEGGSAARAAVPVSDPETISFRFAGEEFTVSGFERTLPAPASASERSSLVRAGLAAEGASLDEDGWHTVARAVVSPDAAAAQLRSSKGQASALIEEHVEGATLRSLHTRVWLTELFPGHQPRTSQGALPVEDPEVQGDVNEDGQPYARVVYRYRDHDHLRAHLTQTIEQTRHANPNPYDRSILARRITRALIAHPCRLEFTDGSEHIDVLAVRDGITRLTSAWALLTEGDSPYADEIAATAVKVLMSEKTSRRGASEKALSQRMALGRQEALVGFLAEFQRGVNEAQPTDRSVRLGQTLVVPAQVTVGVHRHNSAELSAEEVFDDAIRSILASIHVEFRHWDAAAQNVEVGTRAISRIRLPGLPRHNLLEGIIGLAVGRRKPTEVPAAFLDASIPGTALWRAVYLVHFLTRPEIFEQVKKFAKDIKGTSKMRTAGYAELLGPVIDLPWRGYKAGSLQQARNAWANGGVLTKGVMGDWDPVPTTDFTELVHSASNGNENARQTLAVAGGIALITDKLITRNVGSAVGRTVPFRANTDQIVAGLAESEEGLWTLAFAANTFDPERECLNAFTGAQLLGRNTASMYSIPAVDLTAADKIRKDAGGVAPEALSQWVIVALSDPEKARKAENERNSGQEKASADQSIQDQLSVERRALRSAVTEARQAVKRLLTLADTPEARATTLHPFGSVEDQNRIIAEVRKLAGEIVVTSPAVGQEDDEEDEEDGYEDEE
ncbi:hypothetical protein [Kitasatospora sp. NRRL B-11411]|uniref:hypothetical protein n=1 Tax=Kitasatospora sp. NRRL B-11411 TaxID=1463822 RepID=UPI00068BCE29|nr:hypothetical protein [Kitasatospora sp. NRRL B-11411]